ncbi:MAG: RNA pseudouridine synthase, partial [Desulfoprunum sp.]|nr:RNA pseudouridine synthase [Desulfoprunum sp.]
VTQFDNFVKKDQAVNVRWQKIPYNQLYQGIQIVFEDRDLIVIDKPAGLLTVATDTEKRKTAYSILSDYVKKRDPDNKIFVVHRIDRETSGLLLFAKSEEIKDAVQGTWMSTITERIYVAVTEGAVEPTEGVITSWLTESSAFKVYSSQNSQQGKKAVTHYQTVTSNRDYALLKVSLETGRKHQIRVHLQDIGHPVIGDKKYGSTVNPLKRLGLHAQVLAFIHPVSNVPCRYETPVPRQFMRLFGKK